MYNSNDTPYAQPLDAPANGRGVASRPLVRHPGWRAKLHDLLNRPSSSPSARLLHVAVLGVILLSTLFFVLESLPTVAEWGGWGPIDGLVAILFTVEYVARLVVAPDGRGDEEADDAPAPAAGAAGCWAGARCRFARQPMAIIDLCAIVPFWVEAILPMLPVGFLQLLRALRLVRVLRLLRLAQHSKELRALGRCVAAVLPALRLLLFFLGLELLVLGGLMFHAEKGVRVVDGHWVDADGATSGYQSIPDAAYWCLVTVTTVGYGDLVPLTPMGKRIASVGMLTGVIGVAAIISIIGAEMQEVRHALGGKSGAAGAAAEVPPAASLYVQPLSAAAALDSALAAASSASEAEVARLVAELRRALEAADGGGEADGALRAVRSALLAACTAEEAVRVRAESS